MQLNTLERDVMEMLLDGDHPTLQVLRQQFRISQVADRELTGVGFFTTFLVPPDVPRLSHRKSLQLGDVAADIEGSQHGAGFVLFINNGTIDFLEGFSFDEPWPASTDRFHLYYTGKHGRDVSALSRRIE